MRISRQGIELVKQAEGFAAIPYVCPAGKKTVGFGHVVRPGESIVTPMTQAQATGLLISDLAVAELAVDTSVAVPLSQQQYDALVSLAFNIGTGAFASSTLVKRLNEGKYHDAAAQFDRWVFAKKKKLPGLVSRRKVEKALFLDGTKRPEMKPLAKSRTMNGSVALAATGGGAVAVGAVQQIADAAPAVSVVGQVAQTAQEHPSGLLIAFGILVILAAAFIAYARWDDRRKGIR